MVTVERVQAPAPGEHDTLHTLVQRFRFTGVAAPRLAELLWTAPLVGDRALFAGKRCLSTEDLPDERRMKGFVPAPGFAFDVHLRRLDDRSFCARFAQPERRVSYLEGEILWVFEDAPEPDGAAIFDEQINTPVALERLERPLTGPRASLRRWLFFKVGHGKVMEDLARNLAGLASIA